MILLFFCIGQPHTASSHKSSRRLLTQGNPSGNNLREVGLCRVVLTITVLLFFCVSFFRPVGRKNDTQRVEIRGAGRLPIVMRDSQSLTPNSVCQSDYRLRSI